MNDITEKWYPSETLEKAENRDPSRTLRKP